MREFHERYLGNSGFKVSSIHVTSWLDSQGFRWIRVDDYGMGINEYVIENHLLKKGNSFYKSDYFKVLQHEYQEKVGKSFTPISRFGIGLLSCFILGDKIEITSKSVPLPAVRQAEQSIRLSLDSLDGNYILQTASEKHNPSLFPSQHESEPGFRKEYGSSIAVRIKGSKDYLGFEEGIKKVLVQYVTCSPVDIYYNGNKLGVDFDKTLSTPFAAHSSTSFSDEVMQQLVKGLEITIDGSLNLEIIGVDLTKESANPNLKGQLCVCRLKYDDKVFDQRDLIWQFRLHLNGRKFIEFKRTIRDTENKANTKIVQIEISEIFDRHFSHVDLKGIFHPQGKNDPNDEISDMIRVIHNGINIPNHLRGNRAPGINFRECFAKVSLSFGERSQAAFGIVYLQDELIPDLSVSRESIQRIGFNIFSSLYYASRALNNYIEDQYYFDYLECFYPFFSEEEVASDSNVVKGYWDSIPLIDTPKGFRSVEEIKSELSGGPLAVQYPHHKPFLTALIKGLLYIHFDLRYAYGITGNWYNLVITGIKPSATSASLGKDNRPLVFLEFDNETLLSHGEYVNKNHKLVKWILSHEQVLIEKFDNYFNQLMNGILQKQVDQVNSVLNHLRKSSLLSVPSENISKEDFAALEEDLF